MLQASQDAQARPAQPVAGGSALELSSAAHRAGTRSVDNFLDNPVDNRGTEWGSPVGGPTARPSAANERPHPALRYGLVVPKRLARRAVTRNLLRRQMRQALLDHHDALSAAPQGLWVLRLRSAFDTREYPSAASAALRQVARQELQALVASAPRRAGGAR